MACKFMAMLYNPVFWTECIIIVIVLALFFSIMPHLIRVDFFPLSSFISLSVILLLENYTHTEKDKERAKKPNQSEVQSF